MLIIRLRPRKIKNIWSKCIYDLVIVHKSKAVRSQAVVCKLGSFNKRKNLILINLDLFYFWIGRGVLFHTRSFYLLKHFLF